MSRDIVLISSGYDNVIRFWSNFNPGTQCKAEIEFNENAINVLELSPNRDYVAFAAGNSVKFLDLNTLNPNPVLSIDSHEGLISSVIIPPNLNNCFISAGEDSSIRVNDTRVGKAVKTFYHPNYVNSICISNNNKEIIGADENGNIKVWDISKSDNNVPKSEYNSNINEEGLAFRSISFCESEGFLVGAKSNGNVYVFNYENGKLEENNHFEAHKTYITKCLLSPEYNMLATCSADSEIKLWERKPLTEEEDNKNKKYSKNFYLKQRLIGHNKWVWDCDFSLDSSYIFSCRY